MREKDTKIAVVSDVQGNLPAMEMVLALAKECKYEREHTHQVERLALKIFDQLGQLHKLGQRERFLLRCAAILHDIGWLEGQKGHHKTALRIIMDSPVLLFDFPRRRVIGLIARYHRKAMPKEQHAYFRDLDAKDRAIVRKLAGILRVADGLDRTHRSKVKDINCRENGKQVEIVCSSKEPLDAEFAAAMDKGKLFEQIFARKPAFEREAR